MDFASSMQFWRGDVACWSRITDIFLPRTRQGSNESQQHIEVKQLDVLGFTAVSGIVNCACPYQV